MLTLIANKYNVKTDEQFDNGSININNDSNQFI